MSAAGPESQPLAPEVRDLYDQVEAVRRDARALVAGLRPDQLAWRAAPNRWSIADCLEHLTRTAEATFSGTAELIEAARARGFTRRKSYRPGLLERWMLAGMEPPPRHRLRVKATLAPMPDRDPGEAVARFMAAQDEVQERLRAVADLDLRRIRVRSPVFRWLRYRLGFAFAFLIAHERRHLWQARRVRDDPRFPGGRAAPTSSAPSP